MKRKSHKERVLCQARVCVARDWSVIPVPRGTKAPKQKGWPELRLRRDELADAFGLTDNLGIVLGRPSGGLCDVDLDVPEAITVASAFLPPTDRVHGREGKPNSHYWYYAKPVPLPSKFVDDDGTVLVELRSTGQQTLIPPSIHPTGERFRWAEKGTPARVNADQLVLAVRKVAACALLARHWPHQGSRHDATLALAGFLLRSGWAQENVERFVTEAARASSRDEEWKQRRDDIKTTLKRLGEGRPATGLPRLAEIFEAGVVSRLTDWLGLSRTGVSFDAQVETVPLPPDPLGKVAFQGFAGEIVRFLEPSTEADPAGLLGQLLGAFGNAIGRKAHFKVGEDSHFGNVNVALVGFTSKARKGHSWSLVSRLFRDVAPEWHANCIQKGLSTGEGLIWAVRDPIEQGKVFDPGVADKRLLVVAPELARPLRVMTRPANILSTVIREAWDSGDLQILTKTSPAKATAAHISILAHITQDDLLRYLSDTDQGNGFGNRFLWLWVKRSKLLPEGKCLPESQLAQITQQLISAVNWAKEVGEVRRSKQARELWREVYARLSEGSAGMFGALTNRAEAQVTRLSLLYALMDQSPVVRRKHLEAALELWRYAEASVRFIFGGSIGDAVAERILAALQTSPNGLTRTEISNLFRGHRTHREIQYALTQLAGAERARFNLEPTQGRTQERWFAVDPLAKDAKEAKRAGAMQ